MKKGKLISPQLVVKVIFGFFCLLGFASIGLYGLFTGGGDSADTEVLPSVHVWGTINALEMETVLVRSLNEAAYLGNAAYSDVIYTQKNPKSVRQEYIEAIAVGEQPDLLLLDHITIGEIENTLHTISYAFIPKAVYEQTFVQDAGIFIRSDGYSAIPMFLDTMVMFYNENLRRREGVNPSPVLWKDLLSDEYASLRGHNATRDKTLIPLGAYSNYDNAYALFTALVLQALEFNTAQDPLNDGSRKVLSNILQFYTGFANTRSSSYTWHTSFPNARDMFIGEKLVFYPGFVSEFDGISRANPNLIVRSNPLPKISHTYTANITPTVFYAFAVPRTTRSIAAAYGVMGDSLGLLYETLCIAPDGGEYPVEECPVSAQNTTTKPRRDLHRIFSLPTALQHYSYDDAIPSTQKSFVESVDGARSISLTRGDREKILDVIRGAVIGVTPADEGADTLQSVF